VTAAGRGVDAVRGALGDGRPLPISTLRGPGAGVSFPFLPLPEGCLTDVERLPRVRRSSRISLAAVAAARDAIAQADEAERAAGGEVGSLQRTALIFATSNGGAVYTQRFYSEIIERGGGAGSPALFPETVYNAPTSHVAAVLGIADHAMTLVGDSSVGLAAVLTARELIQMDEADRVVVVAAEEADAVLCQAYGEWGIVSTEAEGGGLVFAEAGVAVVLGRSGVCLGPRGAVCGRDGRTLTAGLRAVLRECGGQPDLVVTSVGGTLQDAAESAALDAVCPQARRLAPRAVLGESFAASALLQILLAAECVRRGESCDAMVSSVGFNGQFGAIRLTHRRADG